MRIVPLYILLALTAAPVVQGQEPVSASVSTTQAAVDEIFYLTISAKGADVQEPDLGPVGEAGLQLGTPSVRSSTSIQSVNGQTAVLQSRTWRYPASVSQKGKISIPRISVNVDGREYFTQPIEMEITQSVDMGTRAPAGDQEITVEDLAFVRAVADKTTLYQGEGLTLKLQLYVLSGNYVSVEGPRSLPMPEMEGFYPGPESQGNRVELLNGHNYEVTEFVRVLYPAMPGNLTIGAWTWQGGVRWHDARLRMQSAARMFKTDEIPVTVLPLPEQPEGFGGAVGKFRVDAKLAQNQLTQGTPVRLTVTISGEGNPNTITAPVMPELPWAHVSEPETEMRQQDDTADVSKAFSYLITPLETGEHVIPPLTFVYFAPLIKNYKVEQTPEFPVTVSGAEGGGTLVAVGGSATEQRSRIEVLEDTILPVVTDTAALDAVARTRGGRLSTAALVSPALPLASFVALFLLLAWRGRLERDRGYARRFFAKKRYQKTLADARHASDPTEALGLALKQFIADMLNINDAGLTSSDVETVLADRGVDPETAELPVRVLRACERARYAGRAPAPEEVDALYAATANAVERLQTALREKRS